MKTKMIDLNTYPRKDHFLHFLDMANPFLSLTAQVDITSWFNEAKKTKKPFFLSLLYEVAKVANSIPELRQRIEDNNIIELDECALSYTVALDDGTYRYCGIYANLPYDEYIKEAKKTQKEAITAKHLEETINPLHCFFISCLPWVSFTSLDLPFPDNHFSNPCITFGKYYNENKLKDNNGKIEIEEKVYIPITIMVNHALVDGYHLGIFFNEIEKTLA